MGYLAGGVALSPSFLGVPLGAFGGLVVGLVGGGLALYHGWASIRGRVSRPFRLPPLTLFGLAFALVLGLGSALLVNRAAVAFLFPPLLVLGASLPPLAVLAWAARRLGYPLTWRQAALALVCGATLSVAVAIVLETLMPLLWWSVVYPLEGLAGFLPAPSRLLSPELLLFLVITMLTAPLPEEFAKVLGLPLFGRGRIRTAAQALAIGLAFGAGFALLENMLYEGVYAVEYGWSWAGVTMLRGLGGVLHPLCSGLVALGVFQAREKGARAALGAFAAAVGLHTLWNGGFTALLYLAGQDESALASVEIYGQAIEWLLVVFLLALILGLWWLLARLTSGHAPIESLALQPAAVSPRALAGWAAACALVLIPIGVALGPGWRLLAGMFVPR